MPTSANVENRAAAAEEAEVVTRLRAGDERSFEQLVDTYHSTMLGVARHYVKSRAVAEEVVQDAWVGVLNGLDRFEGRSSLKTWILRIVVNTAMTRGGREARSVRFSALVSDEEDPAVAAERFRGPEDGSPGTGAHTRRTGARCRSRRSPGARRWTASGRRLLAPRGPAHGDHVAGHRGLERR